MSGVQVTRDEEKILRAFYRRYALPYVAGTAAIAVVAIGWNLAGGSDDPAAAAEAVRTEVAKLTQLRGDVQQLLGELEEVRRQTRAEVNSAEERLGGLGKGAPAAARPAAPALSGEIADQKKRIDAALRRLEKAESKLEDLAEASGERVPASASGAAAWDVSSILDRLYAVETRLEKTRTTSESPSIDLLARLDNLEAAQKRSLSERAVVEKSVLNRLYELETRFEEIENVASTRRSAAPPASPTR